MISKTSETNEIFITATVLNSLLTRGIYNICYRDVIDAAGGALGGLKEETFRRWLRNPLWRYSEHTGIYSFKHGTRQKMFTIPASDFGLEYVLAAIGVDNHVRWMRIWTSHFVSGKQPSEEQRQDIIRSIDNFVAKCRKQWREAEDKEALLTELADEFRTVVMPECCVYRGCHGIMTQPVEKGKKTLVYIPRTRAVSTATRRMVFKKYDENDVFYV